MQWFVGVTTAPRKRSLLPETIAHLNRSGWEDVTVFAEPDSDISGIVPQANILISENENRLFAWPNFLQAVECGAHSGAGMIAVVQDDIETAMGMRDYLESTVGPGWHSPYKPGAAECFTDGWSRVPDSQLHKSFGACFLCCTRDTACRFLHTKPGNTGPQGIERWISNWCRKTNTPLMYHTPSLVQHVGAESTIHAGTALCYWRKATDYVNDVRKIGCLSARFS